MSYAPFEQFDLWRAEARGFLSQNRAPANVYWQIEGGQQGLFGKDDVLDNTGTLKDIRISKDFVSLARTVSCHSDESRWQLLYTALWRLTHGEKHLLALSNDPLVRALNVMEKQVRRDAHKAKAFIRFRLTQDEEGEHYMAWHRPDHDVLPLIAGFFSRRFAVMRWTVITPDRALHWNGEALEWGPGAPKNDIDDNCEDLWRTYYRNIFNPARIKIGMMKREMPVRYWETMPETDIIRDMLDKVPERVAQMLKYSEGLKQSAEDFMPAARTIEELRLAANSCEACPLYKGATCTVFGAGPEKAEIMIVGEQPGDQEDKAGSPFVGPAGQVLDDALAQAGLPRDKLYLTNAVKHFKFEQRGGLREHRTPDRRETSACRPWLMAEIDAIKPKAILALGVTSGRSLLGPSFSLKAARGMWHDGPQQSKIRASYHPAAILRAPDDTMRAEYYAALVADLRVIKDAVF
jgi:probable DNA metabolism protein